MQTSSFLLPRKVLFERLSDKAKYRFLEMIPGILVWSTLLLAVALSVFKPLWAIYFIVLFDLYWLLRIVYWLVYLVVAYSTLRKSLKVNWLQKCSALPGWERLLHVVFLPTAGEGEDVLRSTLDAFVATSYPKDRVVIVLAIEERLAATSRPIVEKLQEHYHGVFRDIIITEHPDGIAGEMIGKGSNLNWAGHRIQELVDTEWHVPYNDIVVTAFDSDTQPHPYYFAYLTHAYLTHPDPTHTSYQPVPLYNNNIWQSPAIMRVAANSTTFWLMTEQMRPDRLFTFSSHSMSFTALVDVGFWQNDIVTEDSRIFLQGFLRYDGNYSVTPMYITVSMDTARGSTLWRSLKNLYKQQRRWAYGVENFPFMAWNFARNPLISSRTKARYIFNQLEGVYSWATAPILMFIVGRLPLLVGGNNLGGSILAQNAPSIINTFMLLAMAGIIISAALSLTLLPPRPQGHSAWKIVYLLAQWIFLPVSLIVFGSIPATDAQTRLMLGKYLGFAVTEKHR